MHVLQCMKDGIGESVAFASNVYTWVSGSALSCACMSKHGEMCAVKSNNVTNIKSGCVCMFCSV